LTEDLRAKVGDFGLSRKLYYLHEYYDKTGKVARKQKIRFVVRNINIVYDFRNQFQ
jgi:hypothetical protein